MRYLFQPLKIGSMPVKNRIVMPAMDPGFGTDDDGRPTQQLVAYLEERARSGPGMIISGTMPVHPSGAAESRTIKMIHLWQEDVLPGLEAMVEAVHRHDVRFGAQINHCGLAHTPSPAISASDVPAAMNASGSYGRAATKEELKEFVKCFGVAADRCLRAGFDFVEIHAAHAYLINEFLTPRYNRRTDEYGGSFENRIRFLLEVLREVVDRVGHKVPVGVRLCGDDLIGEDGWRLPDACRLAPILESEGAAYINVSQAGASYGMIHVNIPPMYEPQGGFVRHAAEVEKHVSIPVGTVGRIKDPVLADRIVREGHADLVCMGRAQLADPDMVEKARKGLLADIRPCVADCLGCIEGILRYGESSCTVNPRVGREYAIADVPGEKSASPRKVLVAGGGCAGLEAARRAAFAGHRVIVCESRGWLGGQLRLAAMIPVRQELADILPWYERELNKLGVEIRLNTEVDEALLESMRPDVLVVATGSLPDMPLGFVKGLGNVERIGVITVDELLEERRTTGDAVLVVGGDQYGLQVADYLSEMGRAVVAVENGSRWAEHMALNDSRYLMERLKRKGVKRHRNVEEIEILPKDDVWMVNEGRRERLPGIETIVVAAGRRPNAFLAEAADRRGIETKIVGDAGGVNREGQGTIMAAIATGYDAGRQI
ncbi:MAG: FAD-dependent oxidoreductase [Dehalococcoidia bacterium]|nr:FAD-dependent oxidoreductase [Dehalococcoidia bacterium]